MGIIKTLLKVNINYCDNGEEPIHPLNGFSAKETYEHLRNIRREFPGYDNYEYDKMTSEISNKNRKQWYNLVGLQFNGY